MWSEVRSANSSVSAIPGVNERMQVISPGQEVQSNINQRSGLSDQVWLLVRVRVQNFRNDDRKEACGELYPERQPHAAW